MNEPSANLVKDLKSYYPKLYGCKNSFFVELSGKGMYLTRQSISEQLYFAKFCYLHSRFSKNYLYAHVNLYIRRKIFRGNPRSRDLELEHGIIFISFADTCNEK